MDIYSIMLAQAVGLVIGDHLEGQIEGRNAAREGLRKLAADSVSWRLAWSGRIWPGQETYK
jgi:hypothetical protein